MATLINEDGYQGSKGFSLTGLYSSLLLPHLSFPSGDSDAIQKGYIMNTSLTNTYNMSIAMEIADLRKSVFVVSKDPTNGDPDWGI